MMPQFRTILVANRGEIACRIMRTALAMGYRTAAVHSDADVDALHVRQADVAASIGPAEAGASYLNIDAVIEAAKRLEADAVHPGYGFLSENASFARACAEAGLVFIGPPADAIASMGNKAEAKRRMVKAGVPCVPGYHGNEQTEAALTREAQRIGFPIMVKAAAGGGGRGMRLVSTSRELPAALSRARAEAESGFGSGELILEKAITQARHIEIQVLADTHGHVIHLGERDCSTQRRHQKVIEEAPSPAVDAELRERMGAAAVAAARAIGYINAGTVEFLLAPDGAFYFLEMNTRLQVEHPVTELITSLDLVELQIRIARGEPLALRQLDISLDGHAIEARLYAEAPHQGFLPQSGRLVAWRPPSGPGIRVDHGLSDGQVISPHYDPLLAKIIAHGSTRAEARRRLMQALAETVTLGLPTNRGFLIDCLAHPEFADSAATTKLIAQHFANIAEPAPGSDALAVAAALWFEANARQHGHDPARVWASNGAIEWPLKVEVNGNALALTVTPLGSRRYRIKGDGNTFELEICVADGGHGKVLYRLGTEERSAAHVLTDDCLYLQLGSRDLCIRETLYQPHTASGATGNTDTEVRAPMNGKVVAVLVAEGEKIEKGQRLVVVEAMKMQHELTAGASGTVIRVPVKPGEAVAARQVLVELQPTQ